MWNDNESFFHRQTGGPFFQFGNGDSSVVANLTDDQTLWKCTHAHARRSQTCTPRQCISADTIYPQESGFIILICTLLVPLCLVSHTGICEHADTHLHIPPHDKHAGVTVCCPVATATHCLGNQQGWRRLFPDQWCVCVLTSEYVWERGHKLCAHYADLYVSVYIHTCVYNVCERDFDIKQ